MGVSHANNIFQNCYVEKGNLQSYQSSLSLDLKCKECTYMNIMQFYIKFPKNLANQIPGLH